MAILLSLSKNKKKKVLNFIIYIYVDNQSNINKDKNL